MAPTAGEVLDWVRSARVTLYIWLYFGLSLLIGLLMRLRPDPYTSREAMYVRLVGELWLNAVRAVGLPLLVCSLACAIYDLGLRASAKYGLFLLLWSVASKLLAGLLAAGLSALVQPGARTGAAAAAALAAAPPPSQRLALGDAVLDLLRAALPENPVEACVRYAHAMRAAAPNGTAPGTDDPFSYKESSVYVYQADMLGVVVGTSAVGVAMALLGESAVNLVEVSTAVRDTCMVLTRWLMAPAGPCLLLAIVAKLAGAYNISEQIEAMLPLVWSLALTFGVQLVLYLVVYEAVVARRDLKRLLRLMWHQSETVVTALASSSAHVAYPLAYRGLVEKHGAEQHSASLLLAAASVLNADGSAALLAAQGLWAVQRQELAVPGHYAAAVGLGLLGSVAAFGEVRMHANLLVMVLTTLGAHSSVQDIAPLLVVSWLLDPLASLVNVASAVAAAATLSAVRERELQMKTAAD